MADGPNQLWCWYITWLPTTVKGRYFYWYMIQDVYSRKLVANEVHESESAEQAAQLLRQACLREQRAGLPLVPHSDNGSAMKGSTMLAAMQNLGVMPSFSRPRVSNDNAYAEALFRTAKYCPLWPERPFDTLEQAVLPFHGSTILAEIKEGRFDYATHFPESPRAAAFSGIGGPSINRTVHEGLGRWLEVQRAKKASSTVSA